MSTLAQADALNTQHSACQVVVYAKMLDICRTDDELASVLAHETAHVLARHAVGAQSDGTSDKQAVWPCRCCSAGCISPACSLGLGQGTAWLLPQYNFGSRLISHTISHSATPNAGGDW